MATPFKQRSQGSSFKMMGSSSLMHDEKVVRGKTKKTVEVSGGNKSERHSDKFSRVKEETSSSNNKLTNLSKEYGGTWTRRKNPTNPNASQFVNEQGQTVKQAAVNQGQKQNKAKRDYIAKNTTKNK